MQILNSILTWVMKKRIHQIELFMKYPDEVQEEVLKRLLSTASFTEFGRKYSFDEIVNYEDFKRRVPVHTYEQLFPHIERLMRGEQNILWPSEVKWFAKSSGTTNARSKFIPVSPEALEECHFKGGKDLLSIYVNNFPETKIFDGKGLAIGGSYQVNEFDPSASSHYGDVSAVILQNLPPWAEFIRTPSLDVALMGNWEEKIDRIASSTAKVNVAHISGVPTWTVLLLQRILELENIFRSIIPSDSMRYWETYNASEGFFGIQDRKDSDELLLMLDYGVFYEFIPMEEWDKEYPDAISLADVELGKNYAMVITTNAGLWRYNIGDTVKFTSLSPYRIKISGRTKHFINAFGEEVIIENADTAISYACEQTKAVIDNYTAAPIYLEKSKRGGHEWIIEFKKQPENLEKFTEALDEMLRKVNSDYDAKRAHNIALVGPKVHCVAEGTFYNWMKKRGKLGGQNKVPRLSNSREYVDDILLMNS
ncbi:MAG: GH3 auxin-responsive promoter family protein [Bacteroidetes bacterium]|nr:GH3 auxin-responsive promoter family protein [Bacteroidota bacterium]